jgi:hypothetical protein
MISCTLVEIEAENCVHGLRLDPEDGGCTLIRKVDKHVPAYAAFHHRRLNTKSYHMH